jgi:hypothetical protein
MMKIIQFQNRIQAFWWEGLPMVKTMGEIWAVHYAPWLKPLATCESSTTRTKTVLRLGEKIRIVLSILN